MRFTRIGTLFLLLLTSLFIVSCEQDEELEILESELADETTDSELRNGNNNGGNANNMSPDLITDWTDLLLEIERYAGGMRPNASARAMAYIYLAAYETAQPGMRGYVSNTRYLQGLNIDDDEASRQIDVEIALNACFADVLDHFLINVPLARKEAISELESDYRAELIEDVTERVVTNSEDWGTYVAQQVIAYSQTDTEAENQILEPVPLSYEPPTGLGFWTYSADPERALFPYWERVRTFVVSTDETTTVPPLAYSTEPGSPYRDQMEEVYQVNNAAREDDGEQLWIAEFWSDDVEDLMMSPPARQVTIANQLVDQYSLSMAETLALFTKIGFALNDAAVAAWKYKYEHMVMRPSVYLQEFIDPDFQTNLYRLVYWPNPGFPGYPSGHSCFASAAGGIFIDTFGDNTDFTDLTHEGREEFRGAPRSFTSFSEMAEENAFSRIPLGVHVRMDCAEGLRLGYEISDGVNNLRLQQQSR
ncbi:vanadium-dependent haloperoxidase [Neolewinella aurantiaca]|uniref:Vanadium-dependent haloperoxidase n=1 Tax=Neolewinella aurantiaca TaxID=2602767 RepID=A0A5C7FI82_9BACT|nr:vanadium-dependent haloperoxidase [Neolewinella aurantiaca]TXF90236.1 vanadium-dependent haloperoxidase [Neolewinella aurantiaca]